MTTNSLRMMPALPFALAFAIGIIIGYHTSALQYEWLLLAVSVTLCLASCFLKSITLRTGFLCVVCLIVGALLMDLQKKHIHVDIPDTQVEMHAVVIEQPQYNDRYASTDFFVNDGYLKNHKIRCYIYNKEKPILGATYNLKGRLRHFDVGTSESNFNYAKWADSHALSALMYVYDGNVIRSDDAIDSMPFMERVMLKSKLMRARLIASLHDKGLQGTSQALVAAMAFGDRSMLTKDLRDDYSRTGAAHLLALSGMHLGVLFMLLTMVFGRLRNKLFKSIIIVVTVWAYVIFVGMPSSVVRAATMLTIYALVSAGGRDSMSINALFLTFAVMLACSPMMIWDVGFQLSFLAVLSIFIFFPPIYNIVPQTFFFEHPLMRFIWSTIAISVAAQIGTTPLSIYYFSRFPLIFLLTNLVAIPLVTALLYFVFLMLMLSFIPLLSTIMIIPVKVCTSILSYIIEMFASWEWGSIENISINWIQLILIYAIIFVLTYMSARLIRR